jgi:hypothetical protein
MSPLDDATTISRSALTKATRALDAEIAIGVAS